MQRCEKSSRTQSKAAYTALLAERNEHKKLLDESTLDNHRIFGLAAKVRELCEKVFEHEKVDAAAKGALKGCKKKRATAVDEQKARLEALLAQTKAFHARLVDVAAQCKRNAKDAKQKFKYLRERLEKVKKRALLVTGIIEKLRKQSTRFAKAADDASNLPSKVLSHVHCLEE